MYILLVFTDYFQMYHIYMYNIFALMYLLRLFTCKVREPFNFLCKNNLGRKEHGRAVEFLSVNSKGTSASSYNNSLNMWYSSSLLIKQNDIIFDDWVDCIFNGLLIDFLGKACRGIINTNALLSMVSFSG